MTVDTTTRRIVEFVMRAYAEPLPPAAIAAAKRHLLDSLGCAIAGRASEPALIARRLAARVTSTSSARVHGDGAVSSPESAAFANTVAMRYLDFNDTLIAKSGLHPSDVIPALIAVGESRGASGDELLRAIVAAYHVLGAFANATDIRERGWDQGILVAIAVAAAGARLAGAGASVVAHAVSIAAVSDVPIRQTRVGALAMWKGCATAAAARNGVFAVDLAMEGMTAPPAPFDGYHGLAEQVTGPLDIHLPDTPGAALAATSLKAHPSEYHSQAVLDLLARIRSRIPVEDLESVRIGSYWVVVDEISEPAKWAPTSRETADHSLPFLVATMLVHGDVCIDSYADARLADPHLRALMARIEVVERPEFTAAYPAELLSELEFTTRAGRRIVERTTTPRGHPRNPMSDADVERKFTRLAAHCTGASQRDRIRDVVGRIEAHAVRDLVDALVEP